MPWVRLDEEFARHPKVLAAGPLGMAMQVAALCYCNSYLTDGFVPRSVVSGLLDLEGLGMRMWNGELFGGGEDANWKLVVSDLLDAGLWDEVPGGYRIHDYHEYQPSKEQVLREREQKKLAGQKGGKASAQARASARGQAPASAHAQAPDQAESKPVPVPVPSSGYVGSSVTEVDARVAPLRQALEDVKLLVRWDKLDPSTVDRIAWLAETHGVHALVAAAQRAWQPDNPPAFANAWLGAWDSLPLPNAARISVVPAWCGQCESDEHRWIELDDGRAAHCPRCHPSTVRSA